MKTSLQSARTAMGIRSGMLVCTLFFLTSPTRANGFDGPATPPALRARGGLGVFLGGLDDIDSLLDLAAAGPWTLHGLDTRAETVAQSRRALQDRGRYGPISVEHWDESRLPYADNLVNLVIIREGAPPVDRAEILRVLTPGGEAHGLRDVPEGRIRKERPPDLDEWTHPWHDAGGSASSDDRAFDIPNAFQWVKGPPFPRSSRGGSTQVTLVAGGRTFHITYNVPENLPPADHGYFLVARDAFNGVKLWSRPWEGPGAPGFMGVNESIVATADRLYASTQTKEVAVIDAASGETQRVLPTTSLPRKLLLKDGLLVVQMSGGLTAFDVEQAAPVWETEVQAPRHILIGDERIYVLSATREKDGRWQHELIAFGLRDGRERWRQAIESEFSHRETAALRLNFAGAGILCLVEQTKIRFVSAEDGSEIWHYESLARSRDLRTGMESRHVGHFLIEGLAYIRDRDIWSVRDPLSGRELRTVEGPRRGPNRACQMLTATSRFGLASRFSHMFDLETGEDHLFRFVRGGCMIGMIPANGMGYISPNACGCGTFSEQLRGYVAVVHSGDAGLDTIEPGPLQRGPAYGDVPPPPAEDPSADWPMYRRDGSRGAFLPSSIPMDLELGWETEIGPDTADPQGDWALNFGRRLTPPVLHEGQILLADPQRHQVVALDAQSGQIRWRFTAGGRITLPPVLHGGLALFGSHDGLVYALRAEDGQRVWRRRIAPSHRRIMAYGQLESAWPVTSILLHDGVAYAAAGRVANADGGVVVHALEPESGEIRWHQRVLGAQHGMPDVLVADGEFIYLMNMRLDAATGEVTDLGLRTTMITRAWNDATIPRIAYPEGIRYLRSGQSGFLNSAWTRLPIGLRMHMSSWTWGESEGELLAFDGETGYAYQVDARENMRRVPHTPHHGGRIEARRAGQDEPDWLVELPFQAEAMLVSEDAVFVAGPVNRTAPQRAGFLRAFRRTDGEALAEWTLPAAPVWDGMAAGDGAIVVVLNDGRVVSLTAPDRLARQ